MLKIGNEVGGWCPRCKLNVNMTIAATDGREIFTAMCRTCRNTHNYRPERSKDELKEEAWKKLNRMRKRKVIKPRRAPEVVKKRRRAGGGDPEEAPKPAAPAEPAFKDAAGGETGPADRARWRELTEDLGPRDGRPYYSDRTYGIGDVMLHKRHGMGIVEQIIHEQACMVLFRTGGQVIEMNRASDR